MKTAALFIAAAKILSLVSASEGNDGLSAPHDLLQLNVFEARKEEKLAGEELDEKKQEKPVVEEVKQEQADKPIVEEVKQEQAEEIDENGMKKKKEENGGIYKVSSDTARAAAAGVSELFSKYRVGDKIIDALGDQFSPIYEKYAELQSKLIQEAPKKTTIFSVASVNGRSVLPKIAGVVLTEVPRITLCMTEKISVEVIKDQNFHLIILRLLNAKEEFSIEEMYAHARDLLKKNEFRAAVSQAENVVFSGYMKCGAMAHLMSLLVPTVINEEAEEKKKEQELLRKKEQEMLKQKIQVEKKEEPVALVVEPVAPMVEPLALKDYYSISFGQYPIFVNSNAMHIDNGSHLTFYSQEAIVNSISFSICNIGMEFSILSNLSSNKVVREEVFKHGTALVLGAYSLATEYYGSAEQPESQDYSKLFVKVMDSALEKGSSIYKRMTSIEGFKGASKIYAKVNQGTYNYYRLFAAKNAIQMTLSELRPDLGISCSISERNLIEAQKNAQSGHVTCTVRAFNGVSSAFQYLVHLVNFNPENALVDLDERTDMESQCFIKMMDIDKDWSKFVSPLDPQSKKLYVDDHFKDGWYLQLNKATPGMKIMASLNCRDNRRVKNHSAFDHIYGHYRIHDTTAVLHDYPIECKGILTPRPLDPPAQAYVPFWFEVKDVLGAAEKALTAIDQDGIDTENLSKFSFYDKYEGSELLNSHKEATGKFTPLTVKEIVQNWPEKFYNCLFDPKDTQRFSSPFMSVPGNCPTECLHTSHPICARVAPIRGGKAFIAVRGNSSISQQLEKPIESRENESSDNRLDSRFVYFRLPTLPWSMSLIKRHAAYIAIFEEADE